MLTIGDRYAKVVKVIQPDNYFLDYVKLNWAVPMKNIRFGEMEKCKDYARAMYSVLKKSLQIYKENYTECNGMMIIIDQHYNIQIDFKGSFFRETEKARDDAKEVYKWFLQFNNMMQVNWESAEINQLVKCTVARVDFASQKKSDFTGKFVPIVSKNKTDIVNIYEIPFENRRYISGLTIGPVKGRKTENVFFRAYDKRFAKGSSQACLKRFHSVRFVRKEWVAKGQFLRKAGISTPEDLVRVCVNPKLIAQVIKRLRKSKDVILRNDNNLYKSLHDLEGRKLFVKGNEISLKDFNKIYSAKFHIFLNKEDEKNCNKLVWNPFKQLKGLISHMGNMTHEEFIEFQELMLKKMEANMYENFDWQDVEQKHFDKLVKVIKLLKEIPKVERKVSLGYKEEAKAVSSFFNYKANFIERLDKIEKVPMVSLKK